MIALILAGGHGTRFWPLSRRQRPKQLLELQGDGSLLVQTVRRLEPLVGTGGLWICTTDALADAVREELPDVPAAQVLGEPQGRNTAPAIAWAVQSLPSSASGEVVVVLPSDHWISDEPGFRDALERGAAAIERGEYPVLTVGIRPGWPETGYGYLELPEPPNEGDVSPVTRFTEKPDLSTAQDFLAGGRHLWNAGIFLFRADVFRQLIAEHLPDLSRGLDELAAAEPAEQASVYARLPSVSIDFGLMEKLDDIGTVVVDCGWNDLGSWAALGEILEPSESGNRVRGDAILVDSKDNLVVADGGTVALLGVEGLAVVRTSDAVLVLPRERAQDVREIVDRLKASNRDDLL